MRDFSVQCIYHTSVELNSFFIISVHAKTKRSGKLLLSADEGDALALGSRVLSLSSSIDWQINESALIDD